MGSITLRHLSVLGVFLFSLAGPPALTAAASYSAQATPAEQELSDSDFTRLGTFFLNANKEQVKAALLRALSSLEYGLNADASDEYNLTTKKRILKNDIEVTQDGKGTVKVLTGQYVISIKDSPKSGGVVMTLKPRFYASGERLKLNQRARGGILSLNRELFEEVLRYLRESAE